MGKLDAILAVAASESQRRRAAGPPARSGSAESESESETVTLFVEFTGPVEDLEALGFRPRTVQPVHGSDRVIATGVMPTAALHLLTETDRVIRAEGSRPIQPTLHQTLTPRHANIDRLLAGTTVTAPHNVNIPPLDGTNVVVAVIDSGIDIYHDAFVDPQTGLTRIRRLWDQTLVPAAGERGPLRLGGILLGPRTYGVEYTNTDIDAQRTAQPVNTNNGWYPQGARIFVRSVDDIGHGTKVAGVAAANSSFLRGAFRGVAPMTELVVVKVRKDTAATTDAFRYVLDYKQADPNDRPVVVNLSRSVNAGPLDGTSLYEQGLEQLVPPTSPGVVVVVSANNAGDGSRHSRLVLNRPANSQQGPGPAELVCEFPVQRAVGATEVHAETWYSGDPVQVEVEVDFRGVRYTAPVVVPPAAPGAPVLTYALANNRFSVDVTSDPYAGIPPARSNIRIDIRNHQFNRVVSDSVWTLRFRAVPNVNAPTLGATTIDCDLTESKQNITIRGGVFFQPAYREPRSTIGAPATVDHFIAVGSYQNRPPAGIAAGVLRMSGFSGRGPTRDGRNKPDLVAPGQTVETTRSFSHNSINLGQLVARLTAFDQGTSFAAPHVAGLVALMLQFKRDLTPEQVRAILRATAVQPPGGPVQNTWDEGWGYGRLDGVAAVADLVWRYNQNPALVADGLTAAGSGESR